MLPAIQLNDQPRCPRHEVANERADGELAIEADPAELPVAEVAPEDSLGRSGTVSKFTGAQGRCAVIGFVHTGPPPAPPAQREGRFTRLAPPSLARSPARARSMRRGAPSPVSSPGPCPSCSTRRSRRRSRGCLLALRRRSSALAG